MKSIILFVVLFSYGSFLIGMDVAKENVVNSSLLRHTRRKIVELDMTPKAYPIAHCAQVLDIAMRDIRYSVEQLPLEQQQLLKHRLASSFAFNIAMLPKELCLKILHYAYDEDGQQYNSNSFFCTPMMQAVMLHQEFRNNPMKIGGKKIEFSTLLTLSPEERNKIRSAVNPSKLSSFFDGSSDAVMSQQDYETIIELIPDDLEGAQVVQLPSFGQRLKMGLCGDYQICDRRDMPLMIRGCLFAQLAWGCGPVFSILGYPVASTIAYSLCGVLNGCLILGGVLYGISQCRNYIVVVTLAQNNQVE